MKNLIKQNINNDEYILCAAIYFDDGKAHQFMPHNIATGVVFCGYRHNNAFGVMFATIGKKMPVKQGFLTSNNRFVDRREAAAIAKNAKQIIEIKVSLHSEDLY